MKVRQQRIGIYSGTFNPVHAGHIAFALQALQAANLDAVYIMPEREPRYKTGVEHYGHRTAMITRALRPHAQLKLLETQDRNFTVTRTLPRLEKLFPGAQLVVLCGPDVLANMALWPHISNLLKKCELCVGLRTNTTRRTMYKCINDLPIPPIKTYIITSLHPEVSSSSIRHHHSANGRGERPYGLLASVAAYIRREWLYVVHKS